MVVNINDIEWDEWSHDNTFGTRSKNLGRASGARDLGIQMVELEPGKQSSPLLYHTAEEEHIFIVEGEATLLEGDEVSHLMAGDYICFLPCDDRGHALFNHSDQVCRFLLLNQHNKDDVVVYPDQNRMLVKALGQVFSHQPDPQQ